MMLCSLAAVLLGTLLIVQIVSENGLGLDLAPQYMFGNIIALASGVAYGLYLFVSRYRTDCDSNVRAWYNFLFAASTIAIMVAFRWSSLMYPVRETVDGVPTATVDSDGNPVSLPWSLAGMGGRSWAVLIAAALITGFGAFYFLTLASRILLAGELATISYQETIMASILGFILFQGPEKFIDLPQDAQGIMDAVDDALDSHPDNGDPAKIGRASCRERV